MKRLSMISLKNRLAAANFTANLVGVVVVNYLIFRDFAMPEPAVIAGLKQLDRIFIPFAFIAVTIWTIWHERPVHAIIEKRFSGRIIGEEMLQKAFRRLLNYPFYVMGVDIAIWSLAAMVYTIFFWKMDVRPPLLLRPIFLSFNTGLVTATIVFFVTEHIIQSHMIPCLFPDESLASASGALRIKIGMRLVMILIACNLIPLAAVLQTVYLSRGSMAAASIHMDILYSALSTNAFIFMILGICVVWFVGLNLTIPFKDITRVLQAIKNGHLDQKIQVKSNDEIGYTSEMINEMTEGLKERAQMRQAMELAREVQMNLLPKTCPKLKGMDIAGKSIYCDQTGGDYFDFLEFDDLHPADIGLVVGDVCGHGISSALLMTTARAFLRLRSFLPGDMAQVLSDVNRQLTRDVGDFGQFMTLFYLVINPNERTLSWIRAGHDPAILYDPKTDRFEELRGAGIALGVDENWKYEQNHKSGLNNGQTIVIGTDGIWEASNADGEMFGKAPLYEIIRQNPDASAAEIVDTIMEALDRFQAGHKAEDDITLIVIRIDRKL